MLIDEFTRTSSSAGGAGSASSNSATCDVDLGIRVVCSFESDGSGAGHGVMELRGHCAETDFPISLECPELGLFVVWRTHEEIGPLTLHRARPWSVDSPAVYAVRFTAGGHTEELLVGFRSVVLSGRQILVNGEPLFLRGVHLRGESDASCELVPLKACGVNALIVPRSAPEGLLASADRRGFWIIRERTPDVARRAFSELVEHPSVIGSALVAETPGDIERLPDAARILKQWDPAQLVLSATDQRGLFSDVCLLVNPSPDDCVDLMDRSSSKRLPGCSAGDSAWQRSRPFLVIDADPRENAGWARLQQTHESARSTSAFHGGFLSAWTAAPALEWLRLFGACPVEIEIRRTARGYRPLVTVKNRLHGMDLKDLALTWAWSSTAEWSAPRRGEFTVPNCPAGGEVAFDLPLIFDEELPQLGRDEDLWLTVEILHRAGMTQHGQDVVGHAEWRMPGDPSAVRQEPLSPGEYRPPRLSKATPLSLGPVDFIASGAFGIGAGSFRGPVLCLRESGGRIVPLRRTRVFERAWNERAFSQVSGYVLPGSTEGVRLEEMWWQDGDDVVLRALAHPESSGPAGGCLRFSLPVETDGVRWWGTGPGSRPWEPWTVGRLGEYSAGWGMGGRRDVRWMEFLRGREVILRMTCVPDSLGCLPEVIVEEDGCFTVAPREQGDAEMIVRFSCPRAAGEPTHRD